MLALRFDRYGCVLTLGLVFACSSGSNGDGVGGDGGKAGSGGSNSAGSGSGGQAGFGGANVAGQPGAGGSGGSAGQSGSGGTAGSGGSAGAGGSGGDGGSGGIIATPGLPAVIIDTDMGPDVDDAGALAVMHAMVDNGEATLLGVMISTAGETENRGIGFTDAVDTYYARPDIPIGVWKSGAFLSSGEGYPADISDHPETYPHDVGDDLDDVPDATALYREILAAQPDQSVTIACIGMMNNLKSLLESTADDSSDLSGADLVEQKVALLVQMGGRYPTGTEYNFIQQVSSGTTKAVVDNWPTPVVFSGGEIGGFILSGGPLKDTPTNNPVRRAYEIYNGGAGNTRQSWDLTAVLYAVRGTSTYWDLETVGSNQVEPNGANTWLDTPDVEQSFLVKKAEESAIADVLDDLMTKAPGVAE